MNPPTIYTQEFFKKLHEGSAAAAKQILPALLSMFRSQSLVDVGCGGGEWLEAARDLGIQRVLGVDGFGAKREESSALPILEVDLEQPFSGLEMSRFDICLCLEVAEHLTPKRGETLPHDLVMLSDVIAFSAAIPLQGGHGHINERWPDFWAKRFAELGYLAYGRFRDGIWMDRTIPWWYRQNLILYVKKDRWDLFFANEQPDSANELTLVHPECFLWNARGSGATKQRALEAFH